MTLMPITRKIQQEQGFDHTQSQFLDYGQATKSRWGTELMRGPTIRYLVPLRIYSVPVIVEKS